MDLDRALHEAEGWLDTIDGVEGVAQGKKDGQACLTVFVSTEEAAARLPDRLHGVAVVVERSGPFSAQE